MDRDLTAKRGSRPFVPDAQQGTVLDIAHFSTHDGPGIRTVVFLKGCPLSCVWCHSPDTQALAPEVVYLENKCIRCGRCVAECPLGARIWADGQPLTDRWACDNCGRCADACPPQALQLRGLRRSAREVVAEVLSDAVFFRASGGGVTLSGGEPAMQPLFAEAILRLCKESGIATAIETSGFAARGVYERLAPYADLFLFDLKHLDPSRHRELCGQSNELLLANLRYLVGRGCDLVIRYPVIPGYNDDQANLDLMAALLRELNLRRVDLLPYNPAAAARYRWIGRPYALGEVTPPSPERLREIAEVLGILWEAP